MTVAASPFGIQFFSGSKSQTRDEILKLRAQKRASSVIFANAHVVVEARQNAPVNEALKKSDLVVPDGVPIVWTMHALGDKKAERYSGPDLMEDLFEATKDRRHFFLGSTSDVLEKIKGRFKGIAAGYYSPPFAETFSEAEIQKQLEVIDKSGADFIWVGLGAPKQEKYVVEMARRANSGVWLAVGAALDFYSGNKSRAPQTLQKVGLEWAYRMFTEPKRLAIRYFKTNPKFIKLALAEIAKAYLGKRKTS